jgi:hypothetical protein
MTRADKIARLFGLQLDSDCKSLLTNLIAERFLLCPARHIDTRHTDTK